MSIGEVAVTILLLVVLSFLLFQSSLLMPESFAMMLTVGLIILFLAFSAFIWKEKAGDERDHLHRSNAGRVSFFIGSGVLILGVVMQSLQHEIDPWLIVALLAMILAKVFSRIYSAFRQ